MAELRIYSVTLAFTPPGPLHTSLLIAPDEASASAMAMQAVLGGATVETPVMAVLAVPIDADVLRRMLAAVEGRGPGEVVSLVRPQRQHPETTLDAADAATFTGAAAVKLWDRYRSGRLWNEASMPLPPGSWHPPLVWAEPYTDPDWPHAPREPAA